MQKSFTLLLFLVLSIVNALHAQQYPKGVAVIVESALATPATSKSLKTYIADLENEGYHVYYKVWDATKDNSPETLRVYLQSLQGSIQGAVFIGNLPYARVKFFDTTINQEIEGPSDYYFSSLESFPHLNSDNFFVDQGFVFANIWISHIVPETVTSLFKNKSATDLLNAYFAKNHAYRTCQFSEPKRILYYFTSAKDVAFNNTSVLKAQDVASALDYQLVPLLEANTSTAKEYDFLRRFGRSEILFMGAHSVPTMHIFEDESILRSEEFVQNATHALFVLMHACSAANFVRENNLGSTYIFGNGNVVAALGVTVPSSLDSQFNELLKAAANMNIGEAWISSFNNFSMQLPVLSLVRHRMAVSSILGDGTLRLQRDLPCSTAVRPANDETVENNLATLGSNFGIVISDVKKIYWTGSENFDYSFKKNGALWDINPSNVRSVKDTKESSNRIPIYYYFDPDYKPGDVYEIQGTLKKSFTNLNVKLQSEVILVDRAFTPVEAMLYLQRNYNQNPILFIKPATDRSVIVEGEAVSYPPNHLFEGFILINPLIDIILSALSDLNNDVEVYFKINLLKKTKDEAYSVYNNFRSFYFSDYLIPGEFFTYQEYQTGLNDPKAQYAYEIVFLVSSEDPEFEIVGIIEDFPDLTDSNTIIQKEYSAFIEKNPKELLRTIPVPLKVMNEAEIMQLQSEYETCPAN